MGSNTSSLRDFAFGGWRGGGHTKAFDRCPGMPPHTPELKVQNFQRNVYREPSQPRPAHALAITEASPGSGRLWIPIHFPYRISLLGACVEGHTRASQADASSLNTGLSQNRLTVCACVCVCVHVYLLKKRAGVHRLQHRKVEILPFNAKYTCSGLRCRGGSSGLQG